MVQMFIIVSRQRSGSNHLVSLLNSHRDLRCYGEIFRKNYRVSKIIGNSCESYSDISNRAADPKGFLDEIVTLNSGKVSRVGFKIFPNQAKKVREIFGVSGLRVVHLIRQNLLARYSSTRAAKSTGQGALPIGQTVIEVKVQFDPEKFARFIRNNRKHDNFVKKLMSRVDDTEIFDIAYEDINEPDRRDALLSYLGVTPTPLSSGHQKRNPTDILSRFENPDEVSAFLSEHGFQHWTTE